MAKRPPLGVHVVIIGHRHGLNVYVHRELATARRAVVDYVEEWWKEELGDRPFPKNQDEAIATYFNTAEDEWYEIHQETVRP